MELAGSHIAGWYEEADMEETSKHFFLSGVCAFVGFILCNQFFFFFLKKAINLEPLRSECLEYHFILQGNPNKSFLKSSHPLLVHHKFERPTAPIDLLDFKHLVHRF